MRYSQTKKIRTLLVSFGSFLILGMGFEFFYSDAQACNSGVGLGLGSGWFVCVGLFLLVLLIFRSFRGRCGTYEFVGLGLLLAGALLNILDRLLYGCVVDTLLFFGVFWFNIADVYITGGAVLYLFSFYKKQ